MKDLIYLFAAVTIFVFTACGGGETAAETEVVDPVEAVTLVEEEISKEGYIRAKLLAINYYCCEEYELTFEMNDTNFDLEEIFLMNGMDFEEVKGNIDILEDNEYFILLAEGYNDAGMLKTYISNILSD